MPEPSDPPTPSDPPMPSDPPTPSDRPTPTTEREITGPVDLCRPGGRVLAPEARGWSRTPLHTCALAGRWGRTKRWDYWAVLAGDHVLAIVYGDVDYLGMAEVWWVDLATGTTGGRSVAVPLARGLSLPDRPGTEPLRFRSKHLDLDLVDDPIRADGTGGTTHLRARWDESDGTEATADVDVALPPGHDESLNVVVPWSDRLFQYTSKHQARPTSGSVTVGAETWSADGGWGVLDVGRGRWPYRTRWNWGGGAGVADTGAVVGIAGPTMSRRSSRAGVRPHPCCTRRDQVSRGGRTDGV